MEMFCLQQNSTMCKTCYFAKRQLAGVANLFSTFGRKIEIPNFLLVTFSEHGCNKELLLFPRRRRDSKKVDFILKERKVPLASLDPRQTQVVPSGVFF